MNVLIACEESQTVCIEFRKRGHNAFSCDIQECSGGHPEWHITGDCLPLLNGFCELHCQNGDVHYLNSKWDLIIAHPPCTDLCVSGARHFEKKRLNGSQEESIKFFCNFLNVDCEKVCIENPIGIISGDYIKKYFPELSLKYDLPKKYSQIIHPWMFGNNVSKSTCLWLKGLNSLVPLYSKPSLLEWVEFIDKKTGKNKRMSKWFSETWYLSPSERSKARSKTFPGIAVAMAEQWG